MAWELSSTGFLMTLSGYVPDLIEEDFAGVVNRSLESSALALPDVALVHTPGRQAHSGSHSKKRWHYGRNTGAVVQRVAAIRQHVVGNHLVCIEKLLQEKTATAPEFLVRPLVRD
jgi:hypothetical protein